MNREVNDQDAPTEDLSWIKQEAEDSIDFDGSGCPINGGPGVSTSPTTDYDWSNQEPVDVGEEESDNGWIHVEVEDGDSCNDFPNVVIAIDVKDELDSSDEEIQETDEGTHGPESQLYGQHGVAGSATIVTGITDQVVLAPNENNEGIHTIATNNTDGGGCSSQIVVPIVDEVTVDNVHSEKVASCSQESKALKFTSLEQTRAAKRTYTGEKPYPSKYFEQSVSEDSRPYELTVSRQEPNQIKNSEEAFLQKVPAKRKRIKCSYCDKTFNHTSNVKPHERLHRGERPFKCDYCDKTFTQSQHWKLHERVHTGEKPYHCKYCDKTFSGSTGLRTHARIHTGECFQCIYCDKSFTQLYNLKAHERVHTGEKPYQCKHCDKAFTVFTTLKRHERTHTGEKPFQCQICEKSFTMFNTLTVHMRTHTGERPYECQYCKKTFAQSSVLRVHIRTHTGEKPYHCQLCEKAFTSGSLLIKHQITHTGEKPYQCSYCDKAYTKNYALKRHTTKHTGKKPYECEMCEESFIYSHELKTHTTIHMEETITVQVL